MKWDNLTMSQKQALMKIYVNNGVTNLDEIVNHYNRYAEGGSKETVESPNAVMYSRTPRELVGNVVNTRPVPSLITMTEVPRIGAGVNIPITEAINNIIARRSRINTPTNVVSTDSIVTRTPVSYIGMPTRINRFDEGGYKEITLPEIVVTPEEWQKDFIENFGNKNIRNALYKAFPGYVNSYNNMNNNFIENELENFQKTHDYEINYKKLYDIWNQTGRPKIKEKDILTILGLHNPHYVPILNTIVGKSPNTIIGELAHSVLDKNESFDKISYIKQWPEAAFDYVNQKRVARAFRKGKRDKAFKLAKNLNGVYENPKHYEYKTHSIVEPILKDYILGNIESLDIKNIPLEKK